MEMTVLGKLFIMAGVIFFILGVLFTTGGIDKISFLGRLPGDISIKKDNFVFYFPLATSILISIILSSIIYFFTKK